MRHHTVVQSRLGLRAWVGAVLLSASVTAGAADMDDWWFYVRNDFWHQIDPLIQKGADPNRVDPEGQPTLVEAIRNKAWKTYDGLLEQPNIDLEAANREGETPLMLLSVLGETKRVRALLDRGAQVNRLGWTPLHYAASRGQLEVAQLLIRRKAIINAPSPDGTTPLMMAALSKNEKMVQLLLDAGAEPTTRNLSKLNAADWAHSANADRLANKLDEVIARRERSRQSQPGTSAASASVSSPGSAPAPQRPGQGAYPSGGQGSSQSDAHNRPATPGRPASVSSQGPAPGQAADAVETSGVCGVRLGAEY